MMLPDCFILYRRELEAAKQKWQKIPCNQHGKTINPHQQSVWMDHATASSYAFWDKNRPDAPYGVGLFLNGDGWFLIDLDDCRATDGKWTPEAEALFSSFGGALGEVSTSNNGLHILGRCDPSKLQDRRNKWDGNKEFYTDKRFVALSRISAVARTREFWFSGTNCQAGFKVSHATAAGVTARFGFKPTGGACSPSNEWGAIRSRRHAFSSVFSAAYNPTS